jgi:hypothetical protein
LLFVVEMLSDFENLTGYTPALVEENSEWASVKKSAMEKKSELLQNHNREDTFIALCGKYIVAFSEVKSILKASTRARLDSTETSVQLKNPGSRLQRSRTRDQELQGDLPDKPTYQQY